jgi:hypothetical protein
MGRFTVVVGEEFEIEAATVEVEKAKSSVDPKVVEIVQRYRLALLILGFAAAFILGATAIGFHEGDYGKLQAVYNVVAIPVTAILTFYFKPKPAHE